MATGVPRRSKKAAGQSEGRPNGGAPGNAAEPRESSTCALCADRIRCHTARAKAKCTGCQRIYHCACVAFLPAVEDKKHKNVFCPACRFLSNPTVTQTQTPDVARAVDSFKQDGLYVFPRTVLTRKRLTEMTWFVKALYLAHWRAFRRQTEVKSMVKGFSNFRQRSRGRYEVVYPRLYKLLSQVAVRARKQVSKRQRVPTQPDEGQVPPIWMPILQGILGEKPKLLTSGVFLAMPEAQNQPFHTDGPALSADFNLPCHAINVFIPLVTTGKLNGTQIEPGTQLDPTKQSIGSAGTYKERAKGSKKYAIPEVAAGGAYMFDYRVRHRGLANLTDDARPCLYFTFTTAWFADTQNFSTKRYSKELALPPVFRREEASYFST